MEIMSDNENTKSFNRWSNHLNPLISGAMAGMSVDLTLFPIDTIKTRIQSKEGFWRAGGFRRIYSGLSSAMVGSAPNAALFFCSYESSKSILKPLLTEKYDPINHMISASIGEVIACLVRVPVEVVKQRAQALNISSATVFKRTISADGFTGLYRGYLSTIVREIPFSLIQFPLWEYLKKEWAIYQKCPITSLQSTLCGAIAGGVAAFLTTPLDLAKTRIILSERGKAFSLRSIVVVLQEVHKTKGICGLFSGAIPRVIYISIGGAIFLGGYETFSSFLKKRI